MRLIEGNWTSGKIPMTLLNRIIVNRVSSSGTKGRKSLAPMMSRAMVLRTNP